MEDVLVIDDAVPSSIQNMLEGIALGNKINWFRSAGATYEEGPRMIFPVTPDSLEVHQFTHTLYEINKPASSLFPAVVPVLTAIPYTIKQLIRIKFNLCVYAHTDNPDAHGMPHVDFSEVSEPLISAIYYVNDSTGDTILFDQRYGQPGPLTIRTRVPPKKGRLLVFDGSLLHAGNTPRTNVPRININFNAYVCEGAKTAAQAAAA